MKNDHKSLEDNMLTSEHGRGTEPNKEPTTDPLSAGESRRRFVKGTLAVAPVLMTVVSRPAWGNNCTPSGMVSGNASTPGGDDCDTNGLATADYIAIEVKTEELSATTADLSTTTITDTQDISTTTYEFGLNSYAPPRTIQDLSFFSVFGVLPTKENNGQTLEKTSLKQVLIDVSDETIDGFTDPANFDNWTYSLFDRAAVTAYFNAENGLTPYLSKEMIVSMVYGAKNGGYEVAPGVIWYDGNVLAYFMSTWGEGPLAI